MQMLWFLDNLENRHRPINEEEDTSILDVVFATPLYGMDRKLVALYATLQSHEKELQLLRQRQEQIQKQARDAWQQKGMVVQGFNYKEFTSALDRAWMMTCVPCLHKPSHTGGRGNGRRWSHDGSEKELTIHYRHPFRTDTGSTRYTQTTIQTKPRG